jgi:hypothetical protein
MRILIAMLIVLLALGLVSYLVVAAHQIVSRRRRQVDPRDPWHYIEEPKGGQLLFYAEKRGLPRESLADPLRFNDPDFEAKLYERRNEAEEKMRALNDKDRLLT